MITQGLSDLNDPEALFHALKQSEEGTTGP